MSTGMTKRQARMGWVTWLHALGGRDALREVALTPAPNPELARKREVLLALLDDPAAADIGLEKLCQMAQFGKPDFVALMKDHEEGMAARVATAMAQQALPAVVAEVAARALNGVTPCPCTYGPLGPTEPAFPACRTCMGRGYLYREASIEHQQMLAELGGLIKKGGGVTQNVQVNTSLGGGFFEKFVKATDASSLEVVDAEAIERPAN